jgi:alpha/beta superfamily hydrolase
MIVSFILFTLQYMIGFSFGYYIGKNVTRDVPEIQIEQPSTQKENNNG